MKKLLIILFTAVILATHAVCAGGRWPWRRRIGREVESIHLTAHKNTPPALWPKEPTSPEIKDKERFENAIKELCGKISPARLKKYTETILLESDRFDVDPFLLAALMYDQSRCWPHTPKREVRLGRYGLTRIPVAMHAPQVRRGEYRYFVREDGSWRQQVLKVDRYPFNKWKAGKPESNLYFSAAILKVFKIQTESLHASFKGAPHRHLVSHWFYGDRVRGVEPENRVLTARRRLVAYYNNTVSTSVNMFEDIPIFSPLDGTPRLVLDYFGNKRGNKDGPGHRGVDIDGAAGEPVRAIAAGRVTFAGVDLPGPSQHKFATPKEAAELTNDEMGPGGLYVSINHGNNFGTIYMHLESLAINYRDEVKAGQVIGTLGRSGTKRSGPHLHLEFRIGTDRTDPAKYLADMLVNPY
ncbi:MAG: M23 family metallopeptidase [Proteobacteria bacterium]|nr:M23 family metallopeptidase [Pseudomonadota bacterium]